MQRKQTSHRERDDAQIQFVGSGGGENIRGRGMGCEWSIRGSDLVRLGWCCRLPSARDLLGLPEREKCTPLFAFDLDKLRRPRVSMTGSKKIRGAYETIIEIVLNLKQYSTFRNPVAKNVFSEIS